MSKKNKKIKYRFGLIALLSLLILAVVFCAYMIKTPIKDVVESETAAEVVTHDNNYSYDVQSVDDGNDLK